jgi:hypothetical protein
MSITGMEGVLARNAYTSNLNKMMINVIDLL